MSDARFHETLSPPQSIDQLLLAGVSTLGMTPRQPLRRTNEVDQGVDMVPQWKWSHNGPAVELVFTESSEPALIEESQADGLV